MSAFASRLVNSRIISHLPPSLGFSQTIIHRNYSSFNFHERPDLLRCRRQPVVLLVRNESSNIKDSVIFSYLSECAPTEVMRSASIAVHDFTGLPWWATVVIITATLRTFITLPLAIYQSYILAKVENLSKLDMPEIDSEVKKQVKLRSAAENWTEKRASLQYKIEMKKRWDDLVVKNNCHPFKSTVTLWVQIPTWIFFSAALRNLAYMLPVQDVGSQLAYLQLTVGGLLWIPNLTIPDSTWLLPVILGLTNLMIVEMQVVRRFSEPTRFQRYVTNFFRIFSIALIPISSSVPSVLCLYWTTSSTLALAQNFLLMSNKLRMFCRIPDTPTTFDHPYRQLLTDIKEKTLKLKRS
uniref:Membrane insertase YidC/Oxa/ALB C-terminal domain-containing protein n=1 Tax=Lygus hesperus TaxID=30085 RepID=A0A0K8SM43_LYGHE